MGLSLLQKASILNELGDSIQSKLDEHEVPEPRLDLEVIDSVSLIEELVARSSNPDKVECDLDSTIVLDDIFQQISQYANLS